MPMPEELEVMVGRKARILRIAQPSHEPGCLSSGHLNPREVNDLYPRRSLGCTSSELRKQFRALP